ncbi:hypothetical protein ALQ56_200331 [Pseudomonas syringae pv. papulans]|nr:hypothetical protein ALQ56_200331 [Pseudomonas syringae pv. papulans]
MSNYRLFPCALFSTLLLMCGCVSDVKNESPDAVVSTGGVGPKGIIRHIIFASDPQYPWSKDKKTQRTVWALCRTCNRRTSYCNPAPRLTRLVLKTSSEINILRYKNGVPEPWAGPAITRSS